MPKGVPIGIARPPAGGDVRSRMHPAAASIEWGEGGYECGCGSLRRLLARPLQRVWRDGLRTMVASGNSSQFSFIACSHGMPFGGGLRWLHFHHAANAVAPAAPLPGLATNQSGG